MPDICLCIGCVSEQSMIVTSITEFMENSRLHWAAYWALMVCRLIVLDEKPGVIPVNIGETWQI